jgi:hypothetical protein
MGVPGENKRLVTVPPISIYVAAPAFKAQLSAGIVKPKLHRQAVALFRVGPIGDAVGVLAKPKAAAHIIECDNPAHDMISL